MEKHNVIIVITIVLACIITYQALTLAEEFDPDEIIAIEIGRVFLDDVGRKTGKVLYIKFEEREPNFYWDYALKFEGPDLTGLRTCWVIRFEQAKRPGHFYEVWLDASEYIVVGGSQCR